MKLNNKGFAISTIMYMILVLAIILIVLVLSILTSRQIMLDSVKKDVLSNIYGSNSNETPSFANDSWSTIIKNVKAGNTDAYEIGDEKTIELTGDVAGTYKVRIANKTDNEEGCGGENFSETACGFVVEFVDIITTQKINQTDTNVGGWPESELYDYLKDTIYNALPEGLKNGIKDTKVISGHGKGDTLGTASDNNFESTDKIYLLSPHEVWENGNSNQINYDSAWSNTRQLDYYKGVTTDKENYTLAIKSYNNSETYWWLRSAYSNGTSHFFRVTPTGDWGSNTATGLWGVAPAFRIG